MNLKEIQKRHEADQKRFDNMSWDDVEQTEWDMHEDRAWLLDRISELEAEAIKLRASNEQFELQQIELEANDAAQGA